jgi:chromate reductase
MRILAVSGSLRSRSANSAVLEAARRLATEVEIVLYDGIATLPHFNPDLDMEPFPTPVAAWRAEIANADALLFCSPEYARGVPGSLKNALDWLVSGFEVIGKPIASINASPLAAAGQESLLRTLRTIGDVVEEASIRLPLSGAQRTPESILADAELASALRGAVSKLAAVAAARNETGREIPRA